MVLEITITKGTEVAPLEEEISDSFPCPEGDIFSLPTKDEIVNAFNDILELPGKMMGKLQEKKAEREKRIAELYKKLEEVETEEERLAILKQIEEEEHYIRTQLEGVLQKEIDEVVKTITEFVEGLADILSPYWSKDGLTRDWKKEAKDAFEELLQEFHLYVPTKIAELISALVPISFTINVLGIEINILKLVTDPAYQKEIQEKISGIDFDLQIKEKFKELKEINEKIKKLEEELADPDISIEDHVQKTEEIEKLEEQRKKLLGEIDIIYDLKDGFIDKFWQLVPEEFRQFDGEFGSAVDNKAKAKIIWKWIKKEIKEWLQNWYTKAIETLIGIFDKIWDLLSLPELPIQQLLDIMTFDVKEFIENAIKSLKEKWEKLKKQLGSDIRKLKKEIKKLKEELADPDISLEDHIKKSEELEKKEAELKKLQDEYILSKQEFGNKIRDKILNLKIFGFSIKDILGEIESAANSIEEEISEMMLALEDFKINWHKKIMFDWVKIVKKFFKAIGLGAIFEFMFLTWCDFLKLIGMPMNIGLAGLSIAGIATVASKETKNSPKPNSDDTEDDGIAYTKVEDEGQIDQTEFSVTTGTGTLHAFVDGVEIEHGSGVTISGGTATFDVAPLTQSEYDSGISKDVSLIRI